MDDVLASTMKKGARTICANFEKPTDDWASVMMFKAGDGSVHPVIVEIPENPTGRDASAAGLTEC